jgi:cell division protease FtsH
MTANRFVRSALFPFVIIAALVWLGIQTLSDDSGSTDKLRFSEALQLVREDASGIESVTFRPSRHEIEFHRVGGGTRKTIYPVDQSAYEVQQLLEEKQIPFESKRPGPSSWWSLLTSLLPFVLLLGFWLVLMGKVGRTGPTAPGSQETSQFH